MSSNPDDLVFQLDQELQNQGLPPLQGETLREVYQRMSHPEVGQRLQSGQMTIAGIAQEAVHAIRASKQKSMAAPQAGLAKPPAQPGNLPLSTYAEGGFLNDQSGQATNQMRNQLGIR
jgi:hypothetical protein